MKKRQVIAVALGLVFVFALTLRRTPAAGKPVSANRSADVIFFGNDPSGSPGYKIVGDGAVPNTINYPDDPNTLYASMATINYDVSGDCLLNLRRTSPQRFIRYSFVNPLGDSPIRPDLIDPGPMSVKRIGQMGTTLDAMTNLGAVEFWTALGQVRFGNVERPESGVRDPLGSSSVKIERIGNTWEVSTFRDDCDVDPDHPCHVAVLRQTIKGKEVRSSYTMPFRLIIREN